MKSKQIFTWSLALLLIVTFLLPLGTVWAEEEQERGLAAAEKPKMAIFLDDLALTRLFKEISPVDLPVNLSIYGSGRETVAAYIADGLDLTAYKLILIDTHGSGAGAVGRLEAMDEFIKPAREAGAQIALLDFPEQVYPATVCLVVNHPDVLLYFESLIRPGNALNLVKYSYVHFMGGTAVYVPPKVIPFPGIYHPAAPDLYFENTADFLAWSKNRTDYPFRCDQLTIGILAGGRPIRSGDTSHIDALIRQIETQGANAMVVYAGHVGRGDSPDLLLFYHEDKLLIDAAITIQKHIGGVSFFERREQFIDLGVPILGGVTVGMTPAEWQACGQGIPLGQVGWRLVPLEIMGVVAPTVIAGQDEDEYGGRVTVPLPAQIERLVGRAINHAELSRTPNKDKRIAIIYYNHPPGRDGIGASGLNVPRSLERLLVALHEAGYNVDKMSEPEILAAMQAHGINIGQYAQPVLEEMVNNYANEIILIPVAAYKQWFKEKLPEHRQQEVIARWGEIPGEVMIVKHKGEPYFVLPAIRSGNILLLPQPTRGGGSVCETIVFHDLSLPPHHQYIAFYFWLQQEEQSIDAIIHFGTHGTQEWLPGKERGLAVDCWPYLMSGEIPIIYPYIVDNVGEATQAKRRGDAVIISHMTPVLVAAGLHGDLRTLHDMLHDYLHLEGAVREAQGRKVIEKALAMSLDKEMVVDFAEIPLDELIEKIHRHIHQVEAEIMPFGLHVLGDLPATDLLMESVMKILGSEFVDEVIAIGKIAGEHCCDIEEEGRERAKKLLSLLLEQDCLESAQQQVLNNSSAKLTKILQEGKTHLQNFLESREMEAVLAALAGVFIPPSMGGDPLRTPASLPTGRNLYSFDPRTVPLQSSWEVGKATKRTFLANFYQTHGEYPDKISSVLWVVETMRHRGVAEAQILYAMGVEPVWDREGLVRVDEGIDRGLRLIPDKELGRPRIDVSVIISGLYRDVFPCRIKVIDAAVQLVAEHEEAGQVNHVRRNYLAGKEKLIAAGVPAEEAVNLARARIFGAPLGSYGTGVDDAVKASGTWDDTDVLAELFLSRMGHIYSAAFWGERHQAVFEKALSGTDVAMLSRSSNYFGVLNTDGPFEWLGGLSMVIEHLDGAPPQLMISDLRSPDDAVAQIVTLNKFLRQELRARYYNPRWIKGQMEHGYSGAREMADAVFNLFGFQVTTPQLITDDIWEEMFATFIQDKYNLGLDEFFSEHNPWAQQSAMGRMIEVIERGWWEADPAVIQELVERYIESVAKHSPCCCAGHCANPRFDQFLLEQVKEGRVRLDRETIARFDEQRIATLGVGLTGLEAALEAAAEVALEVAAEIAAVEPVVGEVVEVAAPEQLTGVWDIDLPVAAIIMTILLMGLVGVVYLVIVKKRRN
ncbi:cobaltochelatase subunit CobN [Thermodesulfovibrionales bacterium]|nr:cobaltochelatase subunit CobN [Thermodesulfovibrionales bacterium]